MPDQLSLFATIDASWKTEGPIPALPIGEERGITLYELPCRSILNRCTSERAPFAWSINPYRGCEFGCTYCYARYSHEFLGLLDWREFQNKILVKTEAPRRLPRDLARKARPGQAIAIGTVTDPYQPAERKYRITRGMLQVLTGYRGLSLSLTTKSALITRDLDLFEQIAQQNELSLNVTLITLESRLARLLEPRAPTPIRRLETIRRLAQAGLDVGVFLMPILPGLTDSPKNLETLVESCAKAGARHLVTQVLVLRSLSRQGFLLRLDTDFPALAHRYRQVYERSAYFPEAYRDRLALQVKHLKRRYGILGREDRVRQSEKKDTFELASAPDLA